MTTIVDSLIVQLGLDGSKFFKGEKQANESFKKMKEGAVKANKIVSVSTEQLTQVFGKLRNEALGFFAVLVGARGLKEFVSDLTTSNAEVGRFAKNLGESAQEVSAFGMAVERIGGSSSTAQRSFEGISKSLYELKQNGKALPNEFYRLQAATGKMIDTGHGVPKFFNDTAIALKQLSEIDPARAHFIAQGMGLDDSTANLMIKYGAGFSAYVDSTKKLAASDAAIRAAQSLQKSWATLQQTAFSLANVLYEKVGPIVASLLDRFSHWIETSKELRDAITSLGDYITKIDWTSVGKDLKDGLKEALAVVQAIASGLSSVKGMFVKSDAEVAADKDKRSGNTQSAYDSAAKDYADAHGMRVDQIKPGDSSVLDALRPASSIGAAATKALSGGSSGLKSNQSEAYQAARAEGLSDAAAKAFVANISGESLSNPSNSHWDRTHNAQGMVQWSDERAAAIKDKFGKLPKDMSVAEQTKAAIWEMKTNPAYAQTWSALNSNSSSAAMLDPLVRNYENPQDPDTALASRMKYLRSSSMWSGSSDVSMGASPAHPSLSTTTNNHPVSTSETSNAIHVGRIDINAPRAQNSSDIASGISDALRRSAFTMQADSGQA